MKVFSLLTIRDTSPQKQKTCTEKQKSKKTLSSHEIQTDALIN